MALQKKYIYYLFKHSPLRMATNNDEVIEEIARSAIDTIRTGYESFDESNYDTLIEQTWTAMHQEYLAVSWSFVFRMAIITY